MDRRNKGMDWLGPGARQTAALSVMLTLLLLVLPAFLLPGEPLYQGGTAQPEQQPPAQQGASQQTAASKDRGRAVRLLTEDGVKELTMEDYLWGVVAAEMPASFEGEALKAQACAARTYTVIQQNAAARHEGADICADSTCCQAWVEREAAQARWGLNAGEYTQKITSAVAGTDGLGILYGGAPIQALFFSSAAGKTVDAAQVWGNAVDYLVSVDSPEGEEVPNYHSRVELTAGEVRKAVLAAYPGADLTGAESGWFRDIFRSEGGSVRSLVLGGVTLSGSQVRSLFGLRSAAFEVEWDGEKFVFSVTGYGHGVGMSQYGANAMAKAGSSFRDILTWYYTGTEVEQLW